MNAAQTAMGLEARPHVAGHFRLQWEEVQKAWVLLYPEGMVKLNGSAGEIMTLIDGRRDVQALIDALSARFPDAEGLADDVLAFIEVAHGQHWLQLR